MIDAPPGIAVPELRRVNGVWLSTGPFPLEAPYHRTRALEGRSLEDDVVRDLPGSGDRTPHAREWSARRASIR